MKRILLALVVMLMPLFCHAAEGNSNPIPVFKCIFQRASKLYSTPSGDDVRDVASANTTFYCAQSAYQQADRRVHVYFSSSLNGYANIEDITLVESGMLTWEGYQKDEDQSGVLAAANGHKGTDSKVADSDHHTPRHQPSFFSRCWNWLSDTWLFKLVKWCLILAGIGIAIALIRFFVLFIGSVLFAGAVGGGLVWLLLHLLCAFHLFPESWIDSWATVAAVISGIVMLIYNMSNGGELFSHALESRPSSSAPTTSSGGNEGPIWVTDENGQTHILRKHPDSNSYWDDRGGQWMRDGDSFYNLEKRTMAW